MATILIVDDLAANRDLLVMLLRHQGHRLLEAADGQRGLAVAQAQRPDLVITDVLMPIMDGYELVKQLRLDPATGHIPVIFYTAHYGEREARTLALSSGVAHVLTKPTEPDEVLRIVGQVLAGNRMTRTAAEADAPLRTEYDREHLRLVTDKLSQNVEDLTSANARLRALINIGLELASERDSDHLLQNVCASARDLLGATYITLGIVNRSDRTVERFVSSGLDAVDWIRPGDAPSGILERVVAERRTIRGHNPGGAPGALQLPPGHPVIHAFVAAPVSSPASVYGWICLAGNDGRDFTDDDEQLLTALAGQIGRIYENGYFYRLAQAERDRAQRYLDTAAVILLALDVDGRVTQVNRHACSVLGWTGDDLTGRDWIDTCVPERLRQQHRENFHALLGADLSVIENPILIRSGEERLVEWRNTVLRDDDGRLIGTLSSGTDITERKRAEEGWRVAEERTRIALQSAGVGIWDMDYKTGVLRWSDILERHYGVEPGTFAGTVEAFLARVHPDDRDALVATLGEAAKAGSEFSMEHRSLWPNGTVRWLSARGRVLIDEHAAPVRALGISIDVSEHRALEEQYRQAQKMEAVGRLAGGVAHDFNNLLGVMLASCEFLLEDLPRDDPRAADVTEILKAAERAAGLTRQLLAFSRKQIIEPTLLDLNAVVTGMQAMLARLIGEDVHVIIALAPEPALVNADRGQIEQVVMNLAVNARDAMPRGGTLTIETANVDLDEDYLKKRVGLRPGRFAALIVSDTGTGIAPETQARLFEPFFTTKEVGKGTGLGLATVHGIATGSGGTVTVYSEVGVGTSFRVYFPRAEGESIVVHPPPPISQAASGTHTVLLVEDAAGLREVTRKVLERQGYRVLVAAGAEEAIVLFDDNPSIDLILTDVVMPGSSGPEMARQLVERRPAVKVLFMSGYTEESIVQHGVLKPGIAFLSKPITADALGRKVREVLAVDRTGNGR